MEAMSKDTRYLRFDRLIINNYGCFNGENEFVFNSDKTVILGVPGTGKTMLMNVLINLGFVPSLDSFTNDTFVKVLTHGDRCLVKKYAPMIFLECDYMTHNLEGVYRYAIESSGHKNIKDENEP